MCRRQNRHKEVRMKRLQDQVAVVTGAAQGLGEAIARRLAAEGCRAITIADMNLEKATAVAQSLEAEGKARALALHTNVADETSVNEMIARTVEMFGTVDI